MIGERVSAKLLRGDGRHYHWCPACRKLHPLPDGWHFDGDVERPTFSPSFKHTSGPAHARRVCHYFLTAGLLRFLADCDHELAGQSVALPDLPDGLDEEAL